MWLAGTPSRFETIAVALPSSRFAAAHPPEDVGVGAVTKSERKRGADTVVPSAPMEGITTQ